MMNLTWNTMGFYNETYPNTWVVINEKGCQGVLDVTICITPNKKPQGWTLTLSDESFNRKYSSPQIIVENRCGIHCTLWTLLGKKLRRYETLYEKLFVLGMSCNYVHIKLQSLRSEDNGKFECLLNRLLYVKRIYRPMGIQEEGKGTDIR